MTDKKFSTEYKKYIESAELPVDYQAEILSNLKKKTEEPQKYKFYNNSKLVASLVAAVLVVCIGLSIFLSFNFLKNQDATLNFRVMSATNLKGISGAKIVFISPSGERIKDKNGVDFTAFTDENGTATVTLPTDEDYMVEVTADGFITLEESAEGGNYYISPIMNDDTYRAVLTWDKECDLDAHLSVTAHDNTEKINYYKSDIKDENGDVLASLDVDNETGDGPETITFNADKNSLWRFSVCSYSALKENSKLSLFEAKPKITLYQGNKLVGTYTLDIETADNVWCVFEIKNGEIKLSNYTCLVNAVTEIE